jgi:hypothetical protein
MKANLAKRPLICSTAIVLALGASGYKIAENTRKVEAEKESQLVWLTGASGTLGVRVTSFNSGNANNDCFPYKQGWDRYYTTQYFRGPFTMNLSNAFPNNDNVASVTIDTLHSSNGMELVTGIVISEDGAPTNRVCATNVGSIVYSPNPNLSKASFAPTQTNTLYRLTIFYKSSTAGSLDNVFFNWAYP